MGRFIQTEQLKDISSDRLRKVLTAIIDTSDHISALKSREIEFSKPMITRNREPILYPNTINIIQGQAGSHKSRLAQLIASVLLNVQPYIGRNLDLLRVFEEEIMLLYADTERNIQDQFPYAVQQILLQAGYKITDNPANFDYISLIPFNRDERFALLCIYLELFRKEHPSVHLVVILDVMTDFLKNFNDPEESLKLMDMMNQQVNMHNVTFLGVIHENPGTSKARGHAGTEAMNKASSVIQVNYVEWQDRIISIKNFKNRNSAPFTEFFARYSQETKSLEEISPPDVFHYAPLVKAPVDLVVETLGQLLEPGPMPKSELYPRLREIFKCGDSTLDERIKQVIDEEYKIIIKIGECRLEKTNSGKEKMFGLKLISYEE